MIVIGADTHKGSHVTVRVAVGAVTSDPAGRSFGLAAG
jgi:hypothetical protein